jgi:1-acyl-sn-glycerol-3-phosphate acyltransferase
MTAVDHQPAIRSSRFYRFAQWLARTAWGRFAPIEVLGAENVPAYGPFLLISNHQSNLDPILIQAYAPRAVHAMAKSTQFGVPVIGAIMMRLLSYPVRRYQIDPQAVRYTLRRLGEGHGVSIYMEGERSWDGRLQKPRQGTVRLALKCGVPIVPCAISGSYEAWPRWDRRIRSSPVRIRFGPAIRLPRLDRRSDREALLPEATDRIVNAISALLDPPENPGPPHPAGTERQTAAG